MKTMAPHTSHTKPAVILEVLAEGGSLTLLGDQTDTGWCFRLVRNECALFDLLSEEDREGLVFYDESDWVDGWESALELLNAWPWWHRLHPKHVHPEFRQRIWATVQRRSVRHRLSSLSLTMRRLVSYLTSREVREDRRQAKVRARRQLDLWKRMCRGEPPFPVGPTTIELR
jgi:hypothetical protein